MCKNCECPKSRCFPARMNNQWLHCAFQWLSRRQPDAQEIEKKPCRYFLYAKHGCSRGSECPWPVPKSPRASTASTDSALLSHPSHALGTASWQATQGALTEKDGSSLAQRCSILHCICSIYHGVIVLFLKINCSLFFNFPVAVADHFPIFSLTGVARETWPMDMMACTGIIRSSIKDKQ